MFLNLALLLTAADPPAPFRVVGYLPDYRADGFDPAAARRLTDLTLFSAEPTAAGGLDLSRLAKLPWDRLRAFKTEHRVRLLLAVGGWERSAHFPAVAMAADRRKAFAAEAARVCLDRQLDGLDLDWEHPKTAAEADGYAALLGELKAAFRPHGLQLTVTVAGWQPLPAGTAAAVDWVNLMAYDHPGKHATFEGAKREVDTLRAAGVPAGKITLGVPLYGRHVGTRAATAYRDILSAHRPAADADEAAGVYFNGPATVRRKTEYALAERLGGVMVWELGQDAAGDASLVKVIRDAADRGAGHDRR